MSVVDGTMAFVRDDQVKVGVAETAGAKLARDGIQRADDNLAFKAPFPAVKISCTDSRAGNRRTFPSPACQFDPVREKQAHAR